MIADAHIHLFRHGFWQNGPSPLGSVSDLDAYTALRKQHGIGHALVVGYQAEGIDPANNLHVAELAATHSWITPLAYVDETATPEAVSGLLENGHCGIALYLPMQRLSRVWSIGRQRSGRCSRPNALVLS